MQESKHSWPSYLKGICLKTLTAFWHDRGLDVAAILAFMTLFAMVPLLAISISVLSRLNLKNMEFSTLLLRYFFPLQNFQKMIDKNLSDFTQNATSLGIFGTFILILLCFELMYTVEDSLDNIWKVERRRSVGKRLIIYWSTLTASPILISLSLYLSSKIKSKGFFDAVFNLGFVQNLQHIFLPFILIFFVFFLLYKLIPNARVGNRPAIFGSFFGAILFQISKGIFAYYVYHYSMFLHVYGILGIGFIFLAWTYVSWCIVLGGAEIAFAIQYYHIPQEEVTNHASPLTQPSHALYLAMAILLSLYRHYRRGTYPVTRDAMAKQLGVPLKPLQDILNRLCAHKILGSSDIKGGSYVFQSAPEDIQLDKVCALFNPFGNKPHFLKTIPYEETLNTWIEKTRLAPEADLKGQKLVSLIDERENQPLTQQEDERVKR